MDEIKEFTDDRYKSWCVHCGGWIEQLNINRDHVPSRGLLLEPEPDNLPLVQVCQPCNVGFSLDEEYLVAFLGAALTGTTDPNLQSNPRVSRILARSPKLRERIQKSSTTYETLGGQKRTIWKPEQSRVDRIILKNARGHAYYEYGIPMLEAPDYIRAIPLSELTVQERADFEDIDYGSGWPEVGCRMMTRLLTGQDMNDGWIVVQDNIYRYAAIQTDGTTVRSVLYEYLATEVHWGSD